MRAAVLEFQISLEMLRSFDPMAPSSQQMDPTQPDPHAPSKTSTVPTTAAIHVGALGADQTAVRPITKTAQGVATGGSKGSSAVASSRSRSDTTKASSAALAVFRRRVAAYERARAQLAMFVHQLGADESDRLCEALHLPWPRADEVTLWLRSRDGGGGEDGRSIGEGGTHRMIKLHRGMRPSPIHVFLGWPDNDNDERPGAATTAAHKADNTRVGGGYRSHGGGRGGDDVGNGAAATATLSKRAVRILNPRVPAYVRLLTEPYRLRCLWCVPPLAQAKLPAVPRFSDSSCSAHVQHSSAPPTRHGAPCTCWQVGGSRVRAQGTAGWCLHRRRARDDDTARACRDDHIILHSRLRQLQAISAASE